MFGEHEIPVLYSFGLVSQSELIRTERLVPDEASITLKTELAAVTAVPASRDDAVLSTRLFQSEIKSPSENSTVKSRGS